MKSLAITITLLLCSLTAISQSDDFITWDSFISIDNIINSHTVGTSRIEMMAKHVTITNHVLYFSLGINLNTSFQFYYSERLGFTIMSPNIIVRGEMGGFIGNQENIYVQTGFGYRRFQVYVGSRVMKQEVYLGIRTYLTNNGTSR